MHRLLLLPLLFFLIAPALFAAAPFEDVSFANAEQQERYETLIAELCAWV